MFDRINRRIRRIGIIGAGAAAVVALAGTGTAFAANPPPASNSATVNVNVNSAISINGLTSTLNLSANQKDMGAEVFSVTSNDASGYTLTETAGSANFDGPTVNSAATLLPDTAWNIAGSIQYGNNSAGGYNFSPSQTPDQVVSSATIGTDSYTENWEVDIPSTDPAGIYNNSLTYLATGN